MNKQIVEMWDNIYSLLFTPKIFFENKKPDGLKAALPYFLAGIVISSITIPFGGISSLSSFVSEFLIYIYMNLSGFVIDVVLIYIIIRLLGEKTPFTNIFITLMFVCLISVVSAIVYNVFYLCVAILQLDYMSYIYFSIIVAPIFLIWKSYCAIIGLLIMQQMNKRVATIGALSVFSFFFLWNLITKIYYFILWNYPMNILHWASIIFLMKSLSCFSLLTIFLSSPICVELIPYFPSNTKDSKKWNEISIFTNHNH